VRGTDAVGVDGPDLTHLMTRMTIGAGTLTNDLESLGDWIRRPQDHKEGISMESPDLTDAEIDSLLAYLATLE
jgi:cytochrome c oxidase subunit 2